MSMDRATALEINGRLCNAYFTLQGLHDKLLPDLSDVSLAQAIEATAIIEADPVIERDGNGKTITCHLAERAIAPTLAAAIAATS